MADKKHYDVIIIGTGAGGGTLAYALAPTGKSILLIERGDYVRREKENWSSQAVNLEGRYNTHEVWQDKDGKALHPHTNYYVGGNTKFYGAALFRLREKDFGEMRHHGGISPAWPISYDDMEPYYTPGGTPLPRARRARRGSDRSAVKLSLSVSGCGPRRAHSTSARRLQSLGLQSVSRSARRHARRKRSAQKRLHQVRNVRRFPLPDSCQVRRAGLRRRSRAEVSQRRAAHQRARFETGDQRIRPRSKSSGGRAPWRGRTLHR